VFLKVVFTVGLLLLVDRGLASAEDACPPNCPVKGGGPAAVDCLLEFGGVTATSPRSRVVECADGDPSCDHDPTPGICGFEVMACLNNADPALPTCTASGVDRVKVRGGGEGGRDLQDAINSLLPTSDNICTEVSISVPISTAGAPAPGSRHFSLSDQSFFSINGLTLGTFSGSVDLEAGPADPATGLSAVNVTGSSEYITANIPFGGLVLCLRPITPAVNAGVIVCGARNPGGRAMRINVAGPSGSDRDGLLLSCRGDVNYTTSLTVNSNLGVVGMNGFTTEQCTALHGTVDDSGVCNGTFEAGQLDDFSSARGEMIMAPFSGLNGFPVEITQESALPCGDEGAGGMSAAIALTTMRSAGRVLNADDIEGEVREFDLTGQPFDCENFSEENGPGILVFAAPQLGLPILGDGVTQFRFVDK
jgi:hypothetical protein